MPIHYVYCLVLHVNWAAIAQQLMTWSLTRWLWFDCCWDVGMSIIVGVRNGVNCCRKSHITGRYVTFETTTLKGVFCYFFFYNVFLIIEFLVLLRLQNDRFLVNIIRIKNLITINAYLNRSDRTSWRVYKWYLNSSCYHRYNGNKPRSCHL